MVYLDVLDVCECRIVHIPVILIVIVVAAQHSCHSPIVLFYLCVGP